MKGYNLYMRFSSFVKKTAISVLGFMFVMSSVTGCRIQYVEDETTQDDTSVSQEIVEDERIDINMWYSDEAFSGYLKYCAAQYESANTNVHVNLKYVSEADYVGSLAAEAIKPGKVDLYLIDNDKLEQMKLAGIAAENRLTDIYNVYNYSQTALDACTYNGKLIAFPLSYDTSFLIYNKDYVQDSALTDFDEIKLFAENMEVPAGSSISSVFTCDLQDIFYNYGYLGAYLDIGGGSGDDRSVIFDINDELTQAVDAYRQLIEYFYIDINNVDYYSCINDFENGAIVFTIGDMQMYQNAKNQEGLNVGAVPFPDMSSDIQSAPLSVTTTVVVNPFSDNQTVVESFAKYLTYTNVNLLYVQAGVPACRRIDNSDENLDMIYESYDKSVPKLKLMYSDEFYALLEVAMHRIADGTGDAQTLSNVRDYLYENWQEDVGANTDNQ